MKFLIVKVLKEALKELDIKLQEEEIEKILETPPSPEVGDYAFPCFFLAKQMKQDPNQIALQIREKIGNPPKGIEDIQTAGPYVNFFIDKYILAELILREIITKKDNYGKIKSQKPLRTMVEFPSPNTNKPLHLGHLRNMSIGESVSRILEFNGEKVVRANLNNDRGIHICKSMAAYKFYGKNKKPSKIKSDHFVGDFYVMFNQRVKKSDKLELESHRMLQRWEQGDKETIELWRKMNKWALDGFKETYEKFGVKFDKEYFESQIYKKGKEIILQGVKDKIFQQKKDNTILIKFGKPLGEKILLRSDGTSVYITQDIYLAKKKFEDYKLNKSIYVVGNEQNYHFEVLFTILKKLGFKQEGLKHLSYGMVELPEGKMKSREGTVVDADDLIYKVQELVKKELSSRAKLSKKQLEKRSLKIALASIKYFLLRVDINKNMVFNPKESINFEGDTGPYIQYSYARASSILRKTKKKNRSLKISELHQKEKELIKKISDFNEIVSKAYLDLNPSLIANYSYKLAQLFNEFYHSCPVLNSENEQFRIKLIEAFRIVLKNSLFLLGIETLEKM